MCVSLILLCLYLIIRIHRRVYKFNIIVIIGTHRRVYKFNIIVFVSNYRSTPTCVSLPWPSAPMLSTDVKLN